MNKILSVDVCLSPMLYELYATDNTIVIMLDAIRASASICTALMNNAEYVLPVSDQEIARAYKDQDYVIAGEREGETIKGFDFGNSPFNFSKENISGKKLAFTTTNGTQVVNLVKDRKNTDIEMLIGSFINISALIDRIVKTEKNVLILCSAWKGTVNVEDTLLAGRIVNKLYQFENYRFKEAAKVAHSVFKSSGDSYYDFVMENSPDYLQKVESWRKILDIA
jgi:2-phosphosulfolactate phosphatase